MLWTSDLDEARGAVAVPPAAGVTRSVRTFTNALDGPIDSVTIVLQLGRMQQGKCADVVSSS
jgi:hypothetical protein